MKNEVQGLVELSGALLRLTTPTGSGFAPTSVRKPPEPLPETTFSTEAFNCLKCWVGNHLVESWGILSVIRMTVRCGVLALILPESKLLSLLV